MFRAKNPDISIHLETIKKYNHLSQELFVLLQIHLKFFLMLFIMMELIKVKNHKYREDTFDTKVIAEWPEIDAEEKELIKLILRKELQIPLHA